MSRSAKILLSGLMSAGLSLSAAVVPLTVIGGLAATGTAEASPIPGTRASSLNTPVGSRGQVLTWRVRFTDAAGRPVAHMPVSFLWRNDALSTRPIGNAFTNHNGVATLNFVIPRNVYFDNNILTAISGGGPFTAVTQVRVGIR